MRLTGRIVFAIRAAAELVGQDGYVPLDQIAERQQLPGDYVRSAMSDITSQASRTSWVVISRTAKSASA